VCGVVDVLHPDRNAVQRARVPALRALGVAAGGEGEGPLIVERSPCFQPGFARADACKARLAVGASGQRAVGERLHGPSRVFGRPWNAPRPAAAMRRALSAWTSAASSMIPPRAALTITAVGFIRASCAAPMRWWTSGEYGMLRLTKSDSLRSFSMLTYFAPSC